MESTDGDEGITQEEFAAKVKSEDDVGLHFFDTSCATLSIMMIR